MGNTAFCEQNLVPIPLETSGVYLLYNDVRVVYIGQSLNILARISKHRDNLFKYRRGQRLIGTAGETRVIIFDSVKVHFAKPDELDRLELELINRYQPPFNVRLKRKHALKIDLSKFGFDPDQWQAPVGKKNKQGLLRI